MQSIKKCSPNDHKRRRALGATSIVLLLSMVNAPKIAVSQTPLRIAVAGNFAGPMRSLVQQFEQSSATNVSVSVGSTGKFFAQIRQAAPFDVLLAADTLTVGQLIDQGLADPKTRLTYAIGQLALWSPKPGLFGAPEQAIDILKTGAYGRLAMANPAVAPYGAAAQSVLTHLGLAQAWPEKRVHGQSIAQAHQFVASGNAELGFVALSQIQTPGHSIAGSVWQPPQDWYPPIQQDAVLLNTSKNPISGKAFLTFLGSSDAQNLIKQFGYQLVLKK